MHVIVAVFEEPGKPNDDVLDAIRLAGKGIVHVLDTIMVRRDASGSLLRVRIPGQSVFEGRALRRLLDLEEHGADLETDRAFHDCVGVGAVDIEVAMARIPPLASAVAMLVELSWEARIRTSVEDAGGRILVQGILAPDGVRAAGTGLRTAIESSVAARWIAAAEAATAIDSLAFSPAAAADPRSRSVALALRTLIAAGHIDEADGVPALIALIDEGLIDPGFVQAGFSHDAVTIEPGESSGTPLPPRSGA